MRTSRRTLVGVFGACLVMALLAVFAIELSNTQAKSRADVESQVNQRAGLAATLINSLFQGLQQEAPQDSTLYGAATVSPQALDAAKESNTFVAVLGADGQVLAASSGFDSQIRAGMSTSGALKLAESGHPFGLGNYESDGASPFVDYANAFPTSYGRRILYSGFSPSDLAGFMADDLRTIPGAKGSVNYVIDGNNVVLASSDPAVLPGSSMPTKNAAQALRHEDGDFGGRYYSSVKLADSDWRIVLVSPNGPLFASVSGFHQDLPWVIFAAFALGALVALLLGLRVLQTSQEVEAVNVQLARLNDELTEANRSLESRAAELFRSNEELDRFASIASHDLQEPLRKIQTFTSQLTEMEAENLSEKGRDYLRRTNDSAARMQRLVEDLLKFSRVSTQANAFVPVDLAEVMRGVESDLEAQVRESSAAIRVTELPVIMADPLQMRQLLQNLVSNALKFRREGIAPEVQISAESDPRQVRLVVRDNGIGFDPRYSQRIFWIFERLHGRNEYPGTGIGLALCRKIVDRHGGTIVAAGRPGEGATFTITLPRSATAPGSRGNGEEAGTDTASEVPTHA